MFRNALISVSDKTGLVPFAKDIVAKGCRIISTGGTANFLRENGIPVTEVSQITNFPEVFGGRVKTLHPHIHMSLLYRDADGADADILHKYSLDPFDLVVCNLYPFSKTVLAEGSDEEIIENIDIGGPTIIRAAAKNFKFVTVITETNDYERVLNSHNDLKFRQEMAGKAFSHIAHYDIAIASWFKSHNLSANDGRYFMFDGEIHQALRYGENPHQKATWYKTSKEGLHSLKVLQGKELSYNNLIDLDAVRDLMVKLGDFSGVAVKHTNPCSVVSCAQAELVVSELFAGDPVSIFGGILGFNFEITEVEAKILSEKFVECIWATSFSQGALDVFRKKKNLRLIQGAFIDIDNPVFRSVDGGVLVQDQDRKFTQPADWKVFGGELTKDIIEDIIFGEAVVASLKSNAIALIKSKRTLGLGMGQVNRVDAVKQAGERMGQFFPAEKEIVMVSDAFFPFPDSIKIAKTLGVRWIAQPGGAMRDQEIIEECLNNQIILVLTGIRHFRH